MTKSKKLGVVMDPIHSINPKKDTSLALMLEAQKRGYELYCIEIHDLFLVGSEAFAQVQQVEVSEDTGHWFLTLGRTQMALGDLGLIFMRKDPPFDLEYIMATYILERAELAGSRVVNSPQALRDANEKVFTAWFPECCPPSLMTRNIPRLLEFLEELHKIVVKPTDRMGGQGIFVVEAGDPNARVILEEITKNETRFIQAQKYLPEIQTGGDKRIILIDGIPLEEGITRIPAGSDHRGNMAAGAKAQPYSLNDRDRWICKQLEPVLRKKGLSFVGIDIIGDFLTEINVTSPTGIREILTFSGIDGAGRLFDFLEK
ncbi:glutathione synthase [Algoriphagus namhaensis]